MCIKFVLSQAQTSRRSQLVFCDHAEHHLRTRLEDDPKKLAVAFASAVTVPGDDQHWIARNGEESLYRLLHKVLPQVMCL